MISNVPHHPSPHGTGINTVCTESDSMAEIVWEIVRTIPHTISAPQIIKNLLKTNESNVFIKGIVREIVCQIVCTISRTISLTISASSPTQFPRI